MQAVGRFELLSQLGAGGMGAVYLARDGASGREVALKLLTGLVGPEERARFLREAQAAARLRHPGVVSVHEVGEAQGRPYLVMERVEGGSLRALLQRAGRLDPGLALPLAAGVAEALAAAHAQGVVHRDLKPENVLLDAEGRPRLTDFGLARLVEGDRSLTRTGELLGTPGYMAPEQLRGEHAGPPADVFALGVLLYELLTGQRPHQAGSLLALMEATLAGRFTPLIQVRPDLDLALTRLVERCLAPDPAQRPAASAFAEALRTGFPRRAPPAWRLIVGLGVGLTGLAAAVSIGTAPAQGEGPPPQAGVVAESASPPSTSSATELDTPAWFTALPAAERPSLPLPSGLRCSPLPGEYLWDLPDGSSLSLVWVPGEDGFYLGADEVTWGQLRSWLRADGQPERITELRPNNPGLRDPAVCVAWYEAQHFVMWAGVRLPTRAEWMRGAELALASGQGAPRAMQDGVKEWLQDPPPPALPPEVPSLPGSNRLTRDAPPMGRLVTGGYTLKEGYLQLGSGDRHAPFDVGSFQYVGFRVALDARGARPAPRVAPWTLVAALVPRAARDARDMTSLLASPALRREIPPSQLALAWPSRDEPFADRRGFVRALEDAGVDREWFALRASTQVELPAGRWALFAYGCNGLSVRVDGAEQEVVGRDGDGSLDICRVEWTVPPAQPPLRFRLEVDLRHSRGHIPKLMAMVLPD